MDRSIDGRFKVGDVIVFLKDIHSSDHGRILLIPAHTPCVITNLNTAHVTVDFKGSIQKLRYIPKRMAPAGALAEAIYG